MFGKSSKHILPNGGLFMVIQMWSNTVESKKSPLALNKSKLIQVLSHKTLRTNSTCWFLGVRKIPHCLPTPHGFEAGQRQDQRTKIWRIIPVSKCMVRITPIYTPWNAHLEGVPQPYLGDENDHHGYENHLRPSWDDPPSITSSLTCWGLVW